MGFEVLTAMTMKIAVFRDVIAYSVMADVSEVADFIIILKKEVALSFKTLIYIHQTTRYHLTEQKF
jgi:hypothetical protein